MEREIEITSAGVKVSLNEFARRIVLNTLVALLGSLHGVDTTAEIRVVVRGQPSARA